MAFDSPYFLFVFNTPLFLFFSWAVLDFGGELSAIQANRADSGPASLNTDVANLDVALSDARLALASFAFDALGAKVVRLYLHLRPTIKLGRFRRRRVFGKTNRYGAPVVSFC